jgi:hypothetical protein
VKSDDVLRALRAEQNLATRKLAVEVWRHLFGRTKRAPLRHLPISPVEATQMRGVLGTLLVALDAADHVSPNHFEEVPAPKSEPNVGDQAHENCT